MSVCILRGAMRFCVLREIKYPSGPGESCTFMGWAVFRMRQWEGGLSVAVTLWSSSCCILQTVSSGKNRSSYHPLCQKSQRKYQRKHYTHGGCPAAALDIDTPLKVRKMFRSPVHI